MTNDNDNKIQDTHDKYTDAYVDILNTYKNQISSSVTKKNELKEHFFNTIKKIMYWLTWIFAGALGLSLILFVIMVLNNYNSASIITGAITTVISSFVTMTISIFKLPKIIANYLFNKKEDNLMNEIIRNIQQYEIDAVKYELERVKLERIKELNSEVSNISNNQNDSDDDLTVSIYDTPSQNIGNLSSVSQNGNNTTENS